MPQQLPSRVASCTVQHPNRLMQLESDAQLTVSSLAFLSQDTSFSFLITSVSLLRGKLWQLTLVRIVDGVEFRFSRLLFYVGFHTSPKHSSSLELFSGWSVVSPGFRALKSCISPPLVLHIIYRKESNAMNG